MLEEVGLSTEHERAYLALVERAEARPAQVAAQLGTPEEEGRALLETLAAAGLATALPGTDPAYQPLPPDVALGTALVRRQEAVENARRAVARLTEQYRAGVRRHDAGELVEIVRGRAALRERLRHLQEQATDEIRWFCRVGHIAMASGENHEEFDALARGVRYRVVYERAMLEEPGIVANVAEGVRCGEEARTAPALPVRLAIVDGTVGVCPLVPDGSSQEPTTAVVGRSQLLDALQALFDSYWDRASPVHPADPLPGVEPVVDQPDAPERLLLSLFVGGLPDKAIASQLGVSPRTVQRRLGDLMARAGVDTRPGLAYQAARRAWL